MHLRRFDDSSDSLENCSVMGSNHAAIVSSRVPFKWEEAPGKPIPAILSSCNDDHMADTQTFLQLPPKLLCQGHQTPLFSQQSPYPRPWLHQNSPLTLQGKLSPSPNHQKLARLYKYLLKTASWSQPLRSPTHYFQSWSSSACVLDDARHDELTLNDRFFFDKALPKEVKCSVSMDSWKAQLPRHENYQRRDVFSSSKALSFWPTEEYDVESSASSPLQPIMFHERDGAASPWQLTSIKASDKFDRDDDDDEGSHDLFSLASSSLEKPSQRTDESMESSCPSSPWILDFGPREHEIHEEKGGSKLVVRLVAIIKLKNMITSKVGKLRKRREGAHQQSNNTSIWSPTLATYLFNQQNEEKENRGASLNDHLASEEEDEEDEEDADDDDDDDNDDDGDESASSSHRFQINPDYHLPTSILRGHLHSTNDVSESEGSSSFRVHQLRLDGILCSSEEEQPEEPLESRHRLSLREQLAEFDDDYPLQSAAPQILDSQRREPTPCKRLGKVRKTVKVLAATIKLILVQTEVGKRMGQRSSLTYGSCLKPTLCTISPLPSSHK